MSLYNSLFGANPIGPVLMKIVGVDMSEIPRYRDAYIEGDQVVLYTRTGGGNDECYCKGECEDGCYWKMNRALEKKPSFISMNYDEFDATYAYFYFSPTTENRELFDELKSLIGSEKPKSVSEKFHELIKSMQDNGAL